MLLRSIRSIVVCLLCSLCCYAAQVQIKVTDPSGVPLNNALVIVQDLDHHEQELFRSLTKDHGEVSPRQLPPGLYRAIASYPYSRWQTTVREFLVRAAPENIDLTMTAKEGFDDIGTSIGSLTVHVLDATGQPAEGARVLVRDAEAHPQSEHWGTTNSQGMATLNLTMSPDTIVVVYRDQLQTFATAGLQTERTLRLSSRPPATEQPTPPDVQKPVAVGTGARPG